LREAYENYSLALDQQNAEQVYDWYISLASRTNSFYNLDGKMEIFDFRKVHHDNKIEYSDIKVHQLTQETENVIKDFFVARLVSKEMT
jgi:hypothetical protein